jgi:hypothetical protein
MKTIVTIAIALSCCASAFARDHEQLTESDIARMADAIYLAEGATRAKVPYGILTIRVRSKEHARQICINTIRNNHERWLTAGKPGEFIHFLADRYCPPRNSTGNVNWKKNVTFFVRKFTPAAPVTLAKVEPAEAKSIQR